LTAQSSRFAIKTVLIVIFAVLFFQNTRAQNRVENILTGEARRITNDSFPFAANTPKGASIFSVKQPSAKMLAAIDNGLSDLFAVARKHNYRNRLNYSDYTIFIARPDRLKDINGNYSPDIAVGAAQYAGSIYDKGGFIYAAGMVLAFHRRTHEKS
jgi:hypothetical protein